MSFGSAQKGNALETAVEMIETAILREDPGFASKDLRIEPKRIISVNGVRHEIDLWVKTSDPHGYDSLFIFECKNWKDKVGKNEVILFEEKIKVSVAQRGFIVAPEFTADAANQAKISGRVMLLQCKELGMAELPTIITHLHGIWTKNLDISASFEVTDRSSQIDGTYQASVVLVGGLEVSIESYLRKWANEAFRVSLEGYPSALLESGEYPHNFTSVREFERGQFSMLNRSIKSVTINCKCTLVIQRGEVVSQFKVDGRGRAFQGQIKFPTNIFCVDIAHVDQSSEHEDKSGYMRIVQFEGEPEAEVG